MKKKTLKAGAFLLAMALIAGLLYVTNALTGYPFSYFVLKHSLTAYMAEHYADTDFVAEKPERSLKLGGFTVSVSSPSSPDTNFILRFDTDGRLNDDGYETNVKSGQNTALRLSRQYNDLCGTIFDRAEFPFTANCTGDLEEAFHGGKESREEPGTYPERWKIEELQLDREYDLSQLSGRYGTVTLNVTTEDVSPETAETALLALRNIMENADLPFRSVELWVFSEEEDENGNPAETLHLLNFAWEEIEPEGLAERVQKALAATAAYYG